MGRLGALFFDVGDTLVFDDPPIGVRFAHAARVAGFAVNDARLPQAWRFAERVGLDAYLAGTDTDDPDVQRRSAAAALEAIGYAALGEAQWHALGQTFVSVPFVRYVPAQVFDLLALLRGRGLRLGIISDWEATLPTVLDELGLSPFFETVSVSAVVGCRKPNPRLFEHALGQMNVLPSEVLHVGDWWELDVRGAQSVGMGALLFDHAGRAPHVSCPRVETFAALASYVDALTAPA